MGWNLGYHAALKDLVQSTTQTTCNLHYTKQVLPTLWKGAVSLDLELQEIRPQTEQVSAWLGCLREFPRKCQVLKTDFSFMFVTHPSWVNQSPLMEHFVDGFSV